MTENKKHIAPYYYNNFGKKVYINPLRKIKSLSPLRLTNVKKTFSIPAMFRISENRTRGLENDSTCNCIYRVYVLKQGILTKNECFEGEDQNSLTDSGLQQIKRESKEIFKGIELFLTSKGEINTVPIRGQLYISPEDDFYSIVLGFKLNNPREIPIQEMRYHVPNYTLKQCNVLMFLISNYNTHEPTSTWDNAHITEGPYETYSTNSFLNFLGITTNPSVQKVSRRRAKREEKNVRKNAEENDKSSDDEGGNN